MIYNDKLLINNIFDYDVILLWMSVNNSTSNGFLRQISVNFPFFKGDEIKSGYGDTRKYGKIYPLEEMCRNNKKIILCPCYCIKNKKVISKFAISCLENIKEKYNDKKIAAISLESFAGDNKIIEDLFGEDIDIYFDQNFDYDLYYYRKFQEIKSKYHKNELSKDTYDEYRSLLEWERINGIYINMPENWKWFDARKLKIRE